MSIVYIFTMMQQLINRNSLTERLCKDFCTIFFNQLDSTEQNNLINTTIIMQIIILMQQFPCFFFVKAMKILWEV